MTLEHASRFESQLARVNQDSHHPLLSSTLGDVRGLSRSGDLTPGMVPNASIGKQGEILFCSNPVKDSKDTREQSMDQKIKDRFGADVFDHLKDWDWLIANRKKLEEGFKKANNQDSWDMAWRMRDLSMVDGKSLIYLSKQDGPTRGDLIPKRHDIYLRRGSFRSDNYIGQLYY